jgi:hypothetical protein
MTFTFDLVQAVNDWQRGGDADQKKRAKALKAAAADLPEKFQSTSSRCYRQIALKDNGLRHLGNKYKLPEAISAWTKSEEVAKQFKDGVPPKEWQGVIFAIEPDNDSVVVDIDALYSDDDFVNAISNFKNKIKGYHSGIDKYGDSQSEVVVEVSDVPIESMHAWGGYSSQMEQLAKLFFDYLGIDSKDRDTEKFKELISDSGVELGPHWLTSADAVERVNQRLKELARRI